MWTIHRTRWRETAVVLLAFGALALVVELADLSRDLVLPAWVALTLPSAWPSLRPRSR